MVLPLSTTRRLFVSGVRHSRSLSSTASAHWLNGSIFSKILGNDSPNLELAGVGPAPATQSSPEPDPEPTPTRTIEPVSPAKSDDAKPFVAAVADKTATTTTTKEVYEGTTGTPKRISSPSFRFLFL
jgi:hypothetical protein